MLMVRFIGSVVTEVVIEGRHLHIAVSTPSGCI